MICFVCPSAPVQSGLCAFGINPSSIAVLIPLLGCGCEPQSRRRFIYYTLTISPKSLIHRLKKTHCRWQGSLVSTMQHQPSLFFAKEPSAKMRRHEANDDASCLSLLVALMARPILTPTRRV
jgi:hypothetical protein